MARVDVIAHVIVSVTYIIAIVILGALSVIDGAAVVAMLAGGGAIVGSLTVADRHAYKNGKHVD